jgi:hypothetical protein
MKSRKDQPKGKKLKHDKPKQGRPEAVKLTAQGVKLTAQDVQNEHYVTMGMVVEARDWTLEAQREAFDLRFLTKHQLERQRRSYLAKNSHNEGLKRWSATLRQSSEDIEEQLNAVLSQIKAALMPTVRLARGIADLLDLERERVALEQADESDEDFDRVEQMAQALVPKLSQTVQSLVSTFERMKAYEVLFEV